MDEDVTVGADDDRLLGSGRRPLTVGLLLTVTAIAFEALAVETVLPVTVRELGGLRLYGWAFSAFMLTDVVGIAVWGRQADRRGPSRPYLAGLLLFAAGLVVGGAAPSMLVLVLGRALQGLGAGALSSTVYVGVGRGYGERAQAMMLAALSSAWVVPGLVGPAIAGTVAERASWRLVFLGLLPVLALAGVLTVPALARFAPVGEAGAPGGPSPLGRSVRLAVGVGLALAGLDSRSPMAAAALVVVGVALAAPALRALVPAGTLSARRGLPAALLSRGMLTFAFFGAEAFLPLGLTSLRGLRPSTAGLVLTGAALTWAAGSALNARLAPRWTRRRAATVGAALVAVGVGGVLVGLVPSLPLAVTLLAWAIAGGGMGIAYSTGTMVVLDESAEGEVGATTAAMQLCDVLGVALGAGIGGASVALAAAQGWGRRPGIAVADAIALLVGVLGVVVASRLPQHRSRSVPAPGAAAPPGAAAYDGVTSTATTVARSSTRDSGM